MNGGVSVFEEPTYSQKDIETMIRISKEIRKEINNFKPNNIDLWNLLFPKWEGTISGTYLECLNAISFNEGFAHLLSFENKNIKSVEWQLEKYNKVYEDSVETMKKTLVEEGTFKQKQYIQTSAAGSYYEKFGAMVGMLYLVNEWLKHVNLRRKEIFDEGYSNFVSKPINIQ